MKSDNVTIILRIIVGGRRYGKPGRAADQGQLFKRSRCALPGNSSVRRPSLGYAFYPNPMAGMLKADIDFSDTTGEKSSNRSGANASSLPAAVSLHDLFI
jgi:hypothetical protein